MPYGIRKREGQNKPYCVVKTTTGETKKCYETMAKARAYLIALNINVHHPEKAKKKGS